VPRAALEVADIFRQHGEAYRAAHPSPLTQLRVMRAIEMCRTATLGGHGFRSTGWSLLRKHSRIETTARYTRVSGQTIAGTASPLDALVQPAKKNKATGKSSPPQPQK